MTIEQLAGEIKVSRSTLSRLETGQRAVSPETLARLTRVIADRAASLRRGDAA